MSEPPFREEAIAHHRAQAGPGRVLRVAPRWTRSVFWLLVLAAAGGLAAGILVKVDEVEFVPATVEGTTIRAVTRSAPAGDTARLLLPSGEEIDVRITDVLGAGVIAQAAKPVDAAGGTLRVRIGSRALIEDLVPGLGS
jgi:hypothetical protein